MASPASNKPCPLTGKPASTENSGGASLLVTKPFGPAGDAGRSTPPLAMRPGTQLPVAPSSTGASTLPPMPLSIALCPSDKPVASARGPRAVINAGGASLPRRVKGEGASASGAALPLVGEPREPLTPVALLPTGAPLIIPGPAPKALLSPDELLRSAGVPQGAAEAGGASTPLAKQSTVANATASLPSAKRLRAGDNASSLSLSSTKSLRSGNAVSTSK
jgi:hypothetical protein